MGNLDEIVLSDSKSKEVRLADLWDQQPVALVFMRHFGCTFCREHVEQLAKEEDRLKQTGGKIVVVGMGTPEHAAHFKKERDLPFELLVDNEREAYKKLGLKRGSWNKVLGITDVAKGVRALTRGAGWSKPKQDPMQLGGAAVIATNGSITWIYRSQRSSDSAPVNTIIEQLAIA